MHPTLAGTRYSMPEFDALPPMSPSSKSCAVVRRACGTALWKTTQDKLHAAWASRQRQLCQKGSSSIHVTCTVPTHKADFDKLMCRQPHRETSRSIATGHVSGSRLASLRSRKTSRCLCKLKLDEYFKADPACRCRKHRIVGSLFTGYYLCGCHASHRTDSCCEKASAGRQKHPPKDPTKM